MTDRMFRRHKLGRVTVRLADGTARTIENVASIRALGQEPGTEAKARILTITVMTPEVITYRDKEWVEAIIEPQE